MNAGSAADVLAAASRSLAPLVHSGHWAHATPLVDIFPSPATMIGICGLSLEAGKNSASARE